MMGDCKHILFFWVSLQASLVSGAEPVAEVAAFVGDHCATCHDDVTTKGDLDLLALPFELGDDANRKRWIHVFDRIESGEMPPPDKADQLSGQARGAFLKVLGDQHPRSDRGLLTRPPHNQP